MNDSIHNQYQELGVDTFYKTKGHLYRNPHEKIIRECLDILHIGNKIKGNNILDLACGSGEVSLKLADLGYNCIGCDPYTNDAYKDRTSKDALNITFDDIIKNNNIPKVDSIICSFALHLVQPSKLPALLTQLSLKSKQLIIITPHKKPNIKEEYGWKLTEEDLYKRVRTRIYRNNLLSKVDI